MTPEGRVKAAVDKVLLKAGAYWHKNVNAGPMGQPALDYHVAHKGAYAGIECKKNNTTHPTVRQTLTMKEVIASGSSVFLIDSLNGVDIKELSSWLEQPTYRFISTSAKEWLNRSIDEQL